MTGIKPVSAAKSGCAAVSENIRRFDRLAHGEVAEQGLRRRIAKTAWYPQTFVVSRDLSSFFVVIRGRSLTVVDRNPVRKP